MMTSYTTLTEKIEAATRTHRYRLANNTYCSLEDRPDPTYSDWDNASPCVVVRLHGHEIVRVFPNGEVWGNDAGWQTHTTKDRLNRFGRVWQKSNEWFYSNPVTHVTDGWQSHEWQRIA
jgi:hypothetical protein